MSSWVPLYWTLTPAIHTKVKTSLIIRLSCGNALKSPRGPAPLGAGPSKHFRRSAIVHEQDRDKSRLTGEQDGVNGHFLAQNSAILRGLRLRRQATKLTRPFLQLRGSG